MTALGHYYLLCFVWCGTAALSYAGHGFFSVTLTLPAVLGSIAGAQVGSKFGSRIGARPIKILFSIAGSVFAVALIVTA